MTDGKFSEILREEFKKLIGEEPILKSGGLSKKYQDFLKDKCKPHWASVVSKFSEKVPDIDAGKVKAEDVLTESRNKTILEEKCAIGIGKSLAEKKKLYEKKYGIKF